MHIYRPVILFTIACLSLIGCSKEDSCKECSLVTCPGGFSGKYTLYQTPFVNSSYWAKLYLTFVNDTLVKEDGTAYIYYTSLQTDSNVRRYSNLPPDNQDPFSRYDILINTKNDSIVFRMRSYGGGHYNPSVIVTDYAGVLVCK